MSLKFTYNEQIDGIAAPYKDGLLAITNNAAGRKEWLALFYIPFCLDPSPAATIPPPQGWIPQGAVTFGFNGVPTELSRSESMDLLETIADAMAAKTDLQIDPEGP